MTEPLEDLADEAQAGRENSAPVLALTGVTLAVAVIVVVVLALAVLAFLLAR